MLKIKEYKNKLDMHNMGFLFIYFDKNSDVLMFKKFIKQFKSMDKDRG